MFIAYISPRRNTVRKEITNNIENAEFIVFTKENY